MEIFSSLGELATPPLPPAIYLALGVPAVGFKDRVLRGRNIGEEHARFGDGT